MDFTLKATEIISPSTLLIKTIKAKILKFRWPIYGALLIVTSSFIAHSFKEVDGHTPPIEQLVDTYIPQGYVLVPLEIQNSKNLDSIIGNKAVVDLYGKNPDEKATRRIGSALRLLRSPQKASEVSILIPETEVPRVLSQDRLYWVAVHNPNKLGTKIDKDPNKDRIIYLKRNSGEL